MSRPASRSRLTGGSGVTPASAGWLDRRFEALVFDWDGTAVPDRRADASPVRERLEQLSAAGAHVFVVSGTHVGNVDGQLRARPRGPGALYLCLNRGSEVFGVGPEGPALVWRRTATEEEDRALDAAAALAVDRLAQRGIESRIVSQRLNRRKIDIIPEPEWEDPPKARIAELLEAVLARLRRAGVADLAEVVGLAADAARHAGLADPRITSDVKHVEIGLTDKSDSARWSSAWLVDRGITGGLVLVAGDEFAPVGGAAGSDSFMVVPDLARALVVSVGVEPEGVPEGVVHIGGGPVRFGGLLDRQLELRMQGRVPNVDDDPGWVVRLPSHREQERVAEALGALSNGWAGSRASREEGGEKTSPSLVVNGGFTIPAGSADPSGERLLAGPVWTRLVLAGEHRLDERLLDLRTGVLFRSGGPEGCRSMRLVSAAHPNVLALRAEGRPHVLAGAGALAPPAPGQELERRTDGEVDAVRVGDPDRSLVVAAHDRTHVDQGRRVVERLAAWSLNDRSRPGVEWDVARRRLAEARAVGFDRLLAEHRAAWGRRWRSAGVTIEGSPDDELAARFAVFHLLSAAPDEGEAAVGARGMTGEAYGGHVFWDADIFVLPALAAIRPAAARAMLEYRIRRLPAARALAAEAGLAGARFPWESAGDGRDVTPRHAIDRQGRTVAIRTGLSEEHIVADVAWAADRYAEWTGRASFLTGPGRDLVIDTARYWASRISLDSDGAGHLYGVMGPDEYHDAVDDNAYTNVMARWNLRRAAALLVATGGDRREAARWRRLAGTIVDGWDAGRGLYEQFAGYWALEPLLMADVAAPPVAADVVLGPERVAGSQLIKQADVLMLHHLVPDEVVPGSLARCLAFYAPRCAHGSSLSPAIHASLLARAGRPDDALPLFRLAARLDLDDLTGTTAGGLHLATMGGLWQALAFGFLGLRSKGGVLEIDPHLPEVWDALALGFRWHTRLVHVRAEHASVVVSCDAPIVVSVGGAPPQPCEPPGRAYRLEGERP